MEIMWENLNWEDIFTVSKEQYDLVEHVKVAAPEMDEEDKLRAILTGPRAGNCPCGLMRSQCEYHR